MSDELILAPCVRCERETIHEILFDRSRNNEKTKLTARYQVIQCRGCVSISFKRSFEQNDGSANVTNYYPPPISRQRPDWSVMMGAFYGPEVGKIEDLLEEIYTATQNDLPRLALMGSRALLEQVMISKVGDHGSFAQHLKKFHEAGYVSKIQHDALDRILDAGHAVIHRGYAPKKGDLNTALDVMEGILAAIYVHDQHAKWLKIPERPAKPTE